MTGMLREVVLHGTGYAASKLKHPLGGKTGTTNDFTDAWFVGFSPSLTCGVWVGFDEKKTLGNKETGAAAAPVSLLPRVFFSSKPTHTPHVSDGEKPTNHASVKSFVVPVFPPRGCLSLLAA